MLHNFLRSQILYVILQLDFYVGYFVTSWYDKQAN